MTIATSHRRTFPWFAAASIAIAVGGCGAAKQPSDEQSEKDPPQAVRTEVERGPVRVTVEVAPQPVRLSDEPKLTLTIDAAQGVKIDKPPFGEALGDFVIRDFRDPLPEIKDQREITRQIYTLEPTRSGKQQIAPIVVTFTDSRPNGDGKQHTLETEALTVEVASVLDSELPSLDDLQPAEGPIELPEPAVNRVWWFVGGASGLLCLAVIVWVVRRRHRRDVADELSPQEWAYLELQHLIDHRLAETDVKQFYVVLSDIVRRYIERTTGIHAPEQTTEEFLRDIGGNHTFPRDDEQRLRDFLEIADLVKFAKHEPRPADTEESFQRAKIFLGLDSREAVA